MSMYKTTAAAVIVPLAFLTGCSFAEPVEPTSVTVTESAAPAPQPSTQTVTETTAPAPTADESAFFENVLETVWADTTEYDKELICEGMVIMPEEMTDTFVDEFYAGEYLGIVLDRQQIQDFYLRKCGLQY